MKFIISGIGMGIFLNPSFSLDVDEISEEEFQAIGYDAYSCIGQKDIAEVTGFAYNKEPVKARVGDILLIANKYSGVLRFHLARIRESDNPLLREEELLIEEEMI